MVRAPASKFEGKTDWCASPGQRQLLRVKATSLCLATTGKVRFQQLQQLCWSASFQIDAQTCRTTPMERSLLNRSKCISSQRLFVMPDSHDKQRAFPVTSQQKSFSQKRGTPIEDKENVNPDTFELAQNESRQRRHRLPQLYSLGEDCSVSKTVEEVSTPKDCKSRPPLRDITPIFQKVGVKKNC